MQRGAAHEEDWGTHRALPYQAGVSDVGVILGHGQVDGQGDTVGKDGQKDDDLERPERKS